MEGKFPYCNCFATPLWLCRVSLALFRLYFLFVCFCLGLCVCVCVLHSLKTVFHNSPLVIYKFTILRCEPLYSLEWLNWNGAREKKDPRKRKQNLWIIYSFLWLFSFLVPIMFIFWCGQLWTTTTATAMCFSRISWMCNLYRSRRKRETERGRERR